MRELTPEAHRPLPLAYDTPSRQPVSTVTKMILLGSSPAFLPPFVAFFVLSTGLDAV
jgi:hypothetical protein